MMRKAWLFVLGSVAGAVGAYVLVPAFGPSNDALRAEDSTAPTAGPDRALSPPDPAAISPAALPTGREADQLEERVASDPVAALLDAAAVQEPAARRRAVMLVGALWARTDPTAALRQAFRLPTVLQRDFHASVSSEWANLDAQEFLDFAASALDVEALIEGLRLLSASDPARVFDIAGRLPPETGNVGSNGMNALQRAALSALAELDPAAALRHIDPLLPVINVDFVAQDVVMRFARNDPDAALAWLSSLDAATSSHVREVLGGIARVDFPRALQIAAAEQTSFDLFDLALANAALSDAARAADAATSLLNGGSGFEVQVLENLASSWARRDPARFTDWFLTHYASVPTPLAQSIATQLAASDLRTALGLVERLSPDLRAIWIAQIAGPYAAREPLAALEWIEQYRGQPFYDGARAQAAVRVADADPELAVTIVDGLPPALVLATAPRIAAAMAARDPQAAAEWALALDHPSAASAAVSGVVSDWLRRDVESATSWVIALERGELRDDALSALISGSYGTGIDPRPILSEIDSDETRRRMMQLAVYRIAGSQPEITRELLEAMLDDPDYGDWARESLARIDVSAN